MNKFDDTLLDILKDVKTLPNFLDIVFGFLFRRTDFYVITNDLNLGVGFPNGAAENHIKQAYTKYLQMNNVINFCPTPTVITSDEVNVVTNVQREEIVETEFCDNKVTVFDGYNGAVYDSYSWSQTINDVDVQVKIPEKFTAKDLSVVTTPTNISVKIKQTNEEMLEGDLCQKCKHLETVWSIDGCILQIHLEKLKEIWWNCLLTTEEKLDLSKIDCSRPFHELSDEAQAKIEELTWNQDRKRQGLPTSDQLKMENIMKTAWNIEGSPFSGNYDPSNVSFN